MWEVLSCTPHVCSSVCNAEGVLTANSEGCISRQASYTVPRCHWNGELFTTAEWGKSLLVSSMWVVFFFFSWPKSARCNLGIHVILNLLGPGCRNNLRMLWSFLAQQQTAALEGEEGQTFWRTDVVIRTLLNFCLLSLVFHILCFLHSSWTHINACILFYRNKLTYRFPASAICGCLVRDWKGTGWATDWKRLDMVWG